MPLTIGTQLGPYELVALVGKGGMGEVWRARDPRLNREVAINVSSEQFSDRFEREAHAIAALNHPNICQIYDVGPNYLVMELVAGETLRGPVRFDQALPLINQLIDGIEAAHEKNIVHRDLKPANIKFTTEGVVKILDFGLASDAASDTTDDDPGNSPTLGSATASSTNCFPARERSKRSPLLKRSPPSSVRKWIGGSFLRVHCLY